jgi:CDP-diacylglycerol--serine O-phosphatidyltransferase
MIRSLKSADYVTLLNLVSGLLSIFFSLKGNWKIAIVFMIMAAIFDILDGYVARMMKQMNQFGVEIDSIADIVSFGVAPSVLIFESSNMSAIYMVVLCLFLAAGAIRLAYFNINSAGKGYFIGMPITANAIIIPAAFILAFNYVIYLALLSAILMVSPFKIKKW